MKTFNEWLVANGFDPEAVSEQQKIPLQAAWRAEQAGDQKPQNPQAAATAGVHAAGVVTVGGAGGGSAATFGRSNSTPTAADDTFATTMAAIEKENARRDHIRASTLRWCQANIGDTGRASQLRTMCEAAVQDESMTAQKWELEVLRWDRGAGPHIYSPQKQNVTDDVLSAALCQAAGMKTIESEFDAKTLEVAHKQFKGGIGLQELLGTCAKANGWRGDSVKRDLRGAARAAFADGPMAVGPSTLSVSGILSNTANKFVREAWMFVEDVYSRISAKRSVSDFKAITTYSLTGDLTYDKLAPGGEIKHGTLGNETYTNQADTYAKLLGIDRRDYINDDLGAFAQVGRRLGRGGRLKVNDVFWTEFLDNSTFFTSGRGNYDDGTDTAFGNDGLVAADVIWKAMTDPDGKPLGHRGAILLVPPASRIPALRLMSSQSFAAADEEGTDNPWAGMFRVESSVYMANSSYTGYSAKAWFILCDPNDIPVVEIAYLNGQEMPIIETADMDFDRLGTAMRGYHDFGVSLQEYRGGLKLKGEA
jgi:hypothetical protein